MNKDSYVNPTTEEVMDLVNGEGELVLIDYPYLESLPSGIDVSTVVLSKCPMFDSFPPDFKAGTYVMGETRNFTSFPPNTKNTDIKVLGVPK